MGKINHESAHIKSYLQTILVNQFLGRQTRHALHVGESDALCKYTMQVSFPSILTDLYLTEFGPYPLSMP